MPQLSQFDFDHLAAHFTSGCPGCLRCDLYPGVVEDDPRAIDAYVAHMYEAHGTVVRLVDVEEAVEPSRPPASGARRCLRCGSDRIVPDARIEETSNAGVGPLQANLGATHPDALVFQGAVRVALRADLCGECGHVEVRVTDPAAMWAAFCALPPQERP